SISSFRPPKRSSRTARESDHFLRSIFHAVSDGEIEAGVAEYLLTEFDVSPFHAHHDGNLELQIFCGGDHARSEDVAAQDAAEDVDEDGAHAWITHQDAKSVLDLLQRAAAADIQEIRGRPAGVLNDVHGGHGQTSSVDHAGHAAVEFDVIESVFGGFHFEGILFVQIAQFAKIRMTEEGVVIKSHLGVERNQFAIAGKHARINLQQGGIGVDEGAIERLKKRRGVRGHLAG